MLVQRANQVGAEMIWTASVRKLSQYQGTGAFRLKPPLGSDALRNSALWNREEVVHADRPHDGCLRL
jgi:hypothetical protein